MGAVEEGVPDLSRLSTSDLRALRLGAEVMGHKAVRDNRPLVADYFRGLEGTLRLRISGGGRSIGDGPAHGDGTPVLAPSADAADRRLLAEYLDLLAQNERLTPAVRDVCRQLRARDGA